MTTRLLLKDAPSSMTAISHPVGQPSPSRLITLLAHDAAIEALLFGDRGAVSTSTTHRRPW